MNQSIVGYELNGGHICRGLAYTYLFAENGVFIEAENEQLNVLVPVADCQIRGLKPVRTIVQMKHGRIPVSSLEIALGIFGIDEIERYLAIVWRDGRYAIITTNQERHPGSVHYDCVEGAVMDMHSHPGMPALFSPQDNRDEQGLRLYLVAGYRKGKIEVAVRVGVYGYHFPLELSDVFEVIDPTLYGVNEDGL